MNEQKRPPGGQDAVHHEAAVWIARLHAPGRTAQVEKGLRRWLDESEAHRQAFERASELWETAGRIPEHAVPRVMRWPMAASAGEGRPKWPGLGHAGWQTAFVALTVLAVSGWLVLQDRVVRTGVGEQRTVTLEDGSRISLNTDTRISLRYGADARRLHLHSGEALFEVARDVGRPFVVESAGREVRALGTSFIVRRDAGRLAVVLIEGKVEVAPAAVIGSVSPAIGVRDGTVAADGGGDSPDAGGTIALAPGERVVVTDAETLPARDRPRLEPLMAWQRGLVVLDHTPLPDAVAEMNRYSEVQLSVQDPQAPEWRVSGIFRAGDSRSFAQAITRTHGVIATEHGGRIVLSRPSE